MFLDQNVPKIIVVAFVFISRMIYDQCTCRRLVGHESIFCANSFSPFILFLEPVDFTGPLESSMINVPAAVLLATKASFVLTRFSLLFSF